MWPDGSMYKGDVEEGFRHGKGSFYCADNPSIYSGDWVHGKRTGSVCSTEIVSISTRAVLRAEL